MNQSTRRFRRHSESRDAILRGLGEIAHGLESLPVVALEAMKRTRQRLDSRLYREPLRIRTIKEGRLTKNTGRFVVLVLYTHATVPSFTWTFIEALRQSRFNLVVVSNGNLAAAEVSSLLESCCLLVERNNIGRDFGAYKDGIAIANRRFGPMERLVLANDSVFYLPPGLDKLIADLDGNEDFIGVSETHEHHYHVASFLMSFGPAVTGSPAFREFWDNYHPIGTRRWAIFNGEGALTKALMRAGFKPRVLFRAEDLEAFLRDRGPDDAKQVLPLLPPEARREATADLNRGLTAADAVVAAVMKRNQMHTGGFLFRQHLGLPLIKRDIFYRDVYPLEDIEHAVAALELALRDDVLRDVVRRGSINVLGWYSRLLFRHSVV
jgi:hypothetical protein